MMMELSVFDTNGNMHSKEYYFTGNFDSATIV